MGAIALSASWACGCRAATTSACLRRSAASTPTKSQTSPSTRTARSTMKAQLCRGVMGSMGGTLLRWSMVQPMKPPAQLRCVAGSLPPDLAERHQVCRHSRPGHRESLFRVGVIRARHAAPARPTQGRVTRSGRVEHPSGSTPLIPPSPAASWRYQAPESWAQAVFQMPFASLSGHHSTDHSRNLSDKMYWKTSRMRAVCHPAQTSTRQERP